MDYSIITHCRRVKAFQRAPLTASFRLPFSEEIVIRNFKSRIFSASIKNLLKANFHYVAAHGGKTHNQDENPQQKIFLRGAENFFAVAVEMNFH